MFQKLLGEQMAEFRLSMLAVWSNDSVFEMLDASAAAAAEASNSAGESEGEEEDE